MKATKKKAHLWPLTSMISLIVFVVLSMGGFSDEMRVARYSPGDMPWRGGRDWYADADSSRDGDSPATLSVSAMVRLLFWGCRELSFSFVLGFHGWSPVSGPAVSR